MSHIVKVARGGVFGANEPVDAKAPLTPSGAAGALLTSNPQTLKTLALEASAGVLLIVGVAIAIRGAMGWYVGKKVLNSSYGWFWGGTLGVPGLALLGLYKGRK